MKKLILGSILLFGVLLLTGCGSQKEALLRCTATQSGVDVNLNVKFIGKKVDKMDLSYNMDLSGYNDTQINAIGNQDFCTSVKNAMSQYSDAFTNCKQNISNKHLVVTADFDIDKIATSELDKMSSVEDAKTGLESAGYTCTVE